MFICFIIVDLFKLLCTYMLILLLCIYLCYVPVAGHITPAIYRRRFGLLPACEEGLGVRVRARAGSLQPHGASPAC